jgi:hypothetical protein
MELMQASKQWASRPSDERYTSLTEMLDHFVQQRNNSRALTVSSRRIGVEPLPDNKGLQVVGPNGHPYAPTHWAFGQLAQLAEAPAGYLRTLPSPLAADCLNYGFRYKRDIEDVGVLIQRGDDYVLRAATGPKYGRIWNEDIVRGLVERFGDGITGDFRVPGEFGKRVAVTKANTTLYAGDRDMFVFLADEDHRVEVPSRRNGEAGSLARGFFIWNSEVGSKTFGIGTFLFDYVCCNRIVWGAQKYKQLTIRHTAAAPDRWLEEVQPALESYANSSTSTITAAIEDARAKRIDDVADFLGTRFGRRMAPVLMGVHEAEEGRPIESLWDAATAVTAYARTVKFQDDRVDLERKAGDIIDLAS